MSNNNHNSKTPRKSRQRHHPSGSGPSGPRQIAASDYESDAVQYMESRDEPAVAHRLSRTNTDLNVSVLSRYLPGVRSILSIAASATVYLFSETEGWEKCGVEGTMFVVEREPLVTPTGHSLTQVSVFVLNRRALENLVVDLVKVTDCELAEELIIFRLEEDDENNNTAASAATQNSPGSQPTQGAAATAANKVIGIWIHADEEHTREVNMGVIRASWQQARASWNELVQAVAEEQAQMDDEGGILLQTPVAETGPGLPEGAGAGLSAGRRLSITDLFGHRNGNG